MAGGVGKLPGGLNFAKRFTFAFLNQRSIQPILKLSILIGLWNPDTDFYLGES